MAAPRSADVSTSFPASPVLDPRHRWKSCSTRAPSLPPSSEKSTLGSSESGVFCSDTRKCAAGRYDYAESGGTDGRRDGH